jgi:uncharacterized oxidoreductase
MKTSGNTILITGGATGIGFALAESFVSLGNEVIICGRRKEKLDEAQQKLPSIHTRVCDVADKGERIALFNWVKENFTAVNILVNNAGIQKMINLKNPERDESGESEVEINLVAPIHLSTLFIPLLKEKEDSAIINVSSGLGFVPISIMPVYCATKAAMHSFTLSLRHQLKDTSIKVFEVIPPTVDTELDHGARALRGQVDRGIPPKDVADAALKGIEKNEFEILIGMAKNLVIGSRNNPVQVFQSINH